MEYYRKRISTSSNVTFRSSQSHAARMGHGESRERLTNVDYSDTRSHVCELRKLFEVRMRLVWVEESEKAWEGVKSESRGTS